MSLDQFEFVEAAPAPDLAPLVTRYWYLRTPSPLQFERIVPMPFVHVIVNLSAPYRLVRRGNDPVNTSIEGAFVSGLQSTWLVNENPALIHHVGVELQPYALQCFTAMPAAELAGHVLGADVVLPQAADLPSIIGRDPLPIEAIALLESRLRSIRLPASPHPSVIAAVALLADHPERTIASVADEVRVSPQTLVRQFTKNCGITPKAYADVHRFHRFLASLPPTGPLPSWAELAATTGYYDQPHFIRVFTRFTGFTPRAWLEAVRESGRDYPSFIASAEG